MTEKLLPCPFCGGEANQTSELGADCYSHWVICQSCGAKTLTYYDSLYPTTAKKMAKAAWNRRAQPENKPLTLDALREMDGEPVWIVTLDGTDEPRWEIIVSAGKCGCGIDLIYALNGVETRDYADFDLYSDTWLAYRYKPEEATNER